MTDSSMPQWEVVSPEKVRLSGEITRETVPHLWQLIQAWKPTQAECYVSLEHSQQIDSAGLAMLIQLIKHAKNYKCHIMLNSVPEKLTTLIKLSHLTDVFDQYLSKPV